MAHKGNQVLEEMDAETAPTSHSPQPVEKKMDAETIPIADPSQPLRKGIDIPTPESSQSPKEEMDADTVSIADPSQPLKKEIDAPTPDSSQTLKKETDAETVPTSESIEPLKGPRLIITLLALCFAVLCVALDNTIIATAIPYITDQFKNLNDVGWYGSVYLLTTCAFQLLYGKLYKFFSIKLVFLTGLFIFEVGSLICAVAPNSITLIIGSTSCAAARSRICHHY